MFNFKFSTIGNTGLSKTDMDVTSSNVSLQPITDGYISFRKTGNIVVIDGRSAGPLLSDMSNGKTYLTNYVPEAFRPSSSATIPVCIGPNTHHIEIDPNGAISFTINGTATAGNWLFGINGCYIPGVTIGGGVLKERLFKHLNFNYGVDV